MTPLRYPGGKSQLSDFVYHSIKLNNIDKPIYCEPFAGGAGIGISLLLKKRVETIVLNDLDAAIYSIWYAILNDTERLVQSIHQVEISLDTWHAQRRIYNTMRNHIGYSFELAFAAFFLNRTNRSGIITGGPIGGMNQAGKYLINCRFNKERLITKIFAIAKNKERIQLYNLDAIIFLRDVLYRQPNDNLFIFFDPPYYRQGKSLYKNYYNDEKHRQLCRFISSLQDYYWIMTYDNNPTIEQIYSTYDNVKRYSLQYTAQKKKREQELFFHSYKTKIESFGKVQF